MAWSFNQFLLQSWGIIYCGDRPSYNSNHSITIWDKHGIVCLFNCLLLTDLTIFVDNEKILVCSAHCLIYIFPVHLLDYM